MAKIRTYESRLLPQGQINSQASAADFGSGIAQGLSALGQGIESYAEKQKHQEEQDDISRAQTRVSEMRIQETAAESERRQNVGRDQLSTYSEDWLEGARAKVAEQSNDFKTQKGRDYFAQASSHLVINGYESANQFQAKQRASYLKSDYEARVEADKLSALQTQGGSFGELVNSYKSDVSNRAGFASYGSPALHVTLEQEYVQKVAWTSGQAYIADKGKPQAFLMQIGKLPTSSMPSGSEAVANVLYGKESSSGKVDTTKPNAANALGPMQITGDTWETFKNRGVIPANFKWDNKEDNKAAGFKIVDYYYKKYDGDVAKVAAAYNGGEGAIAPDGTIRRDRLDKYTGKTVGEYVDDVVRRTATSASPVMTELPDNLKGKLGIDWFDAMDADKRLAFINQANSKASQEQRVGANNINQQVQNHYREAANKGSVEAPLKRVDFVPLGDKAEDAYNEYTISMEGHRVANTVINQPVYAQDAALESIRPQSNDPKYAEKDIAYQAAKRAIDAGRAEFARDNVQFMVDRGDTNIQIMKDSDPQKVGKEMVSRLATIEDARKRGGTDVLSKVEAGQLAHHITNSSPDDQKKWLSTIKDFGLPKPVMDRFISQVTPDQPIVHAAFALLTRNEKLVYEGGWMSNDKIWDADTQAMRLLRGNQLLKPLDKKEDGKGALPSFMPPTDKLYEKFSQLAGSSFAGRQPHEINAAFKTFMGDYAVSVVDSAESTGLSNKEVKSAWAVDSFKRAIGTTIEHNGGKFLTMWGSDSSKYLDAMKEHYDYNVKQMGGNAPAWHAIRVRSTGESTYAIVDGNERMVTQINMNAYVPRETKQENVPDSSASKSPPKERMTISNALERMAISKGIEPRGQQDNPWEMKK